MTSILSEYSLLAQILYNTNILVERLVCRIENLFIQLGCKIHTRLAVWKIESWSYLQEWWFPYLAQASAATRTIDSGSNLEKALNQLRPNSFKLPLITYFGQQGYEQVLAAWEKSRQTQQHQSSNDPLLRDNPFI